MAYGNALQSLADPTRRKVFERLRQGSQSVGELAHGLPVSRPAVSQHLKVLKDAGLVIDHPAGVDDLRDYMSRFWNQGLAGLKARAERDGATDT